MKFGYTAIVATLPFQSYIHYVKDKPRLEEASSCRKQSVIRQGKVIFLKDVAASKLFSQLAKICCTQFFHPTKCRDCQGYCQIT